MQTDRAVVLVGHGAVPADCPRELVAELKRLESARERRGEPEMSDREAELDRRIRTWPRTPETDPYRAGLEAICERLQRLMPDRKVVAAYNEFCAPSVEAAVEALASQGVKSILLVTTMFTRGGSHSERDLPQVTERLRQRFPTVRIDFAWPFDLDLVAEFLRTHIERNDPAAGRNPQAARGRPA